jgi:hypothetical protein
MEILPVRKTGEKPIFPGVSPTERCWYQDSECSDRHDFGAIPVDESYDSVHLMKFVSGSKNHPTRGKAIAFLWWIIRSLASLLWGAFGAEYEAAFHGASAGRMIGSRRRHPGGFSLGKGEMMVCLVLERWGLGGCWIPVPAPARLPVLNLRCSKAFPSGRRHLRPALLSRAPTDFWPPALSFRQ